jgi:hypothetical protein
MSDLIKSAGYIYANLCDNVSRALYEAMIKDDWRAPIARNKAHGGDMRLSEIAKLLAELGAHMEVTVKFIDSPDMKGEKDNGKA